MSLRREILVYPRIETTGEILEVLPLVRGEWESFVRGRGSDLYRIREYLPDDSARHVDWKATAKSGSLKVREFAREDERKLAIVFDNPVAGTTSEENYEKAVQMAASLAWHFSQHEAEVSFMLPGSPTMRDLHEFLGALAVVKPLGVAAGERSTLRDGPGIGRSVQPRRDLPAAGNRAHGLVELVLLCVCRGILSSQDSALNSAFDFQSGARISYLPQPFSLGVHLLSGIYSRPGRCFWASSGVRIPGGQNACLRPDQESGYL